MHACLQDLNIRLMQLTTYYGTASLLQVQMCRQNREIIHGIMTGGPLDEIRAAYFNLSLASQHACNVAASATNVKTKPRFNKLFAVLLSWRDNVRF